MSFLPAISPEASKVMFAARDKLEKSLVQHQRFNEALTLIRNRILFPSDSPLLFIVGPTGVGKSRLMSVTQKIVFEMMKEELIADQSRLPYVAFEVQATNVGNFAWGPFYADYQAELQLALPPSREVMANLPRTPRELGPHHAVLSAIAHRRPVVTLLDEANHLCQVSNARLLSQQLDKIKSIANRSKTLHVMFGTYELAALLDASAQLARRGNTFHFSRYRWERQGELNAFTQMVEKFGKCLPLDHTLNLASRVEFIYERSLGCGGILKTWLMEALGRACRENRTFIKFQDLEVTAMPSQKRRRLLLEAQAKEPILDERDNQEDSLRELLRTPFPEQAELPLQVPRSGNQSPGTPNPRSDPTGGAFRNEPPSERAG
jgi:hypothetical protein